MKPYVFLSLLLSLVLITPSTGSVAHAGLTASSSSSIVTTTQKLNTEGFYTPQTLKKGTVGAWVIKVTPDSVGGSFVGVASWGDEKIATDPSKSVHRAVPLYLGSYAVFLHTYSKPGKYPQILSLKDEKGRTFRLATWVTVTR
jgi:hypothetical protein